LKILKPHQNEVGLCLTYEQVSASRIRKIN